ncbi:DUF3953 domain-containing protein [Ornithinibacillus salinisoli]|uniref:DUF3953 domain-containing protein n=1 Tax=Ornithinibacillus salinisoli TaxID=1848459 RepID=A0ABW4W243_9BACI
MLKIFRYIFSIITLLIAVHGLITSNFVFQHYMMFFLGLTMLVMGLEEFKNKRKVYGWYLLLFLYFHYLFL